MSDGMNEAHEAIFGARGNQRRTSPPSLPCPVACSAPAPIGILGSLHEPSESHPPDEVARIASLGEHPETRVPGSAGRGTDAKETGRRRSRRRSQRHGGPSSMSRARCGAGAGGGLRAVTPWGRGGRRMLGGAVGHDGSQDTAETRWQLLNSARVIDEVAGKVNYDL
ncbi:hypothetical protein V2A60_001745 [Cordyceps javanica]